MMERASAVTVSVATDRDETDWSGFLQDQGAAATIFHDWRWRNILTSTFGFPPYFLIARRTGKVVGVLPLAHVETRLFGSSLTSLPFCSWAGPIANDRDVVDAMDTFARGIACDIGVNHLEYRSVEPLPFSRPSQDLYVRFCKTISDNHEENLLKIPRKQRAMIRKGISNNLSAHIEDVDQFFPLYLDNVHRHGTPGCPKSFFDAMASSFGDDCQVLVVRSSSGQPLSAVLSLKFRSEIFPFYAGDKPEARRAAANDFKYWEVMKRAANEGLTTFNYGRSKRGTGSFSFKKNWGFEPQPLYYDYYFTDPTGDIPQYNPMNPKYQLAIKVWRRLPKPVVGYLGPRIIRGLG